jgi:hypothetical protein
MYKFLLVFLFLPSLIFGNIYRDADNFPENLLHEGHRAYFLKDYPLAFTYYDLYILYVMDDWLSTGKIEARLGRYCAAFKLGYFIIAENEYCVVKHLLQSPHLLDKLKTEFPDSMFYEAILLY